MDEPIQETKVPALSLDGRNFNRLVQRVNWLTTLVNRVSAVAADTTFLGVIMGVGPNGEDDHTDARYWVQESYCDNDAVANTETYTDAYATSGVNDPVTFDQFATDKARYVTATNLSELDGDTHALPVGTPVFVHMLADQQKPQRPHFVFTGGSGSGAWCGSGTFKSYGAMFGEEWTVIEAFVVDTSYADSGLVPVIDGTVTGFSGQFVNNGTICTIKYRLRNLTTDVSSTVEISIDHSGTVAYPAYASSSPALAVSVGDVVALEAWTMAEGVTVKADITIMVTPS